MRADAPASPAVVVARQPIVDGRGDVVGFELLYRPTQADAPAVDGEQMTAQVVLGALTIGVDHLVGDKAMFCNAERGVLTGETPVTLPPGRTVIEILETVAIDDEVVAGARALVDRGFALALDDFAWVEGAERLLELASIVKIDLVATPRHEVPGLIERCRAFGVQLLAEKVETEADVLWARSQGFDLFQGYAIERPGLVHGRTVAPSALARVQLALTMLTEDLDFDAVEETLSHEPGLVVQILQLASAGADRGLRREVRTVREALVLLGTIRIRQWAALTILGEQATGSTNGLATALTRARMCELLAYHSARVSPEFGFTAGLLSSLDLLLGVPLEHLDSTLTLGDELRTAAFRQQGPAGELVAEVVGYERRLSGWAATAPYLPELDAVAAMAFAWALPFLSAIGPRQG